MIAFTEFLSAQNQDWELAVEEDAMNRFRLKVYCISVQFKIKLLKKRSSSNKPPPTPPTPTRLIKVSIKGQFENHHVGHLPQRHNDTGVSPVVFQSLLTRRKLLHQIANHIFNLSETGKQRDYLLH